MWFVPIIAISTPIGNSAIGVLRISFGNKYDINYNKLFNKLFKKNLIVRQATLVNFYFNDLILDKGIAIFFSKPFSYTGENILEFHGHGNYLNLKFILKCILVILKKKKIRLAKNGEFTKRAFINKKINLNEARNIFSLINANNDNYLSFIHYNFKFDLFKKLEKLVFIIKNIKDYYSQLIQNFHEGKNFYIKYKLLYILKKIYEVYKYYKFENKTTDLSVIVLGAPNTGKSTLVNKILKDNTLIVSPLPGTTRDFIIRKLNINGYNFDFIDTAGLRSTQNKIENLGINLAIKQLKKSNIILYVFDNNLLIENKFYNKIIRLADDCKILIKIMNKVDLADNIVSLEIYFYKNKLFIQIKISAKYSLGVNLIINELNRLLINFNNFNLINNDVTKYIKFIYKHIFNSYNLSKSFLCNYLILNELDRSIHYFNKIFNFKNKNDLNKFFKKFCVGK